MEGERQKYLVEIKPESQALPPERGRKHKKTFLNEVLTYGVNQAKWEQARRVCENTNQKFIVLSLDKSKGWKIVG